jgi:DNA-binding MarR family transcriptional regulator
MTDFNSQFADQSDDSIGLTFIRAYNLWHRSIKSELRAFGITHPQFVILATLGHLSQNGGEVTQRDLSDSSGIDAMTVSTIVRNLESSGLVVREASPNDSRAKSVCLTDEGVKRINQALPIVESIDNSFFEPLGAHRQDLNALLLELIAHTEA